MGASAEQIESIERTFAERFGHWGIQLPPGSAARREAGHIFEQGWHIGFVWGEEDGEEYLDVLAQHRMTNDSLRRLWASGRKEGLPAPAGGIVLPRGATEAEIDRLKAESAERNRALYKELRERGLLPPEGRNLPAMEINEFLTSGGMANEESPPYEYWPKELTDPDTGERLTSRHLSSPGPHARPIGNYEYDENMELACWKCGWRGTAGEGSREWYEELFDISCPRCDQMLLIVSIMVTLQETEAYAAAGNPRAQAQLREMQKWKARFRRAKELALKRADQLPDLPGGKLAFTWDELELEPGEKWLRIQLGDSTVWQELALNKWERLDEIKSLFKERYGERFQSLTSARDSSSNTKFWLPPAHLDAP